MHFALAADDAADDVSFFSRAVEDGLYFLEFFRRNHQHQTDSHVEHAQHLVLRDVAQLPQMLKNRQHRPATQLDSSRGAARQHSRQVFCDAAASDVRHGSDAVGIRQPFDQRPVTLVRPHELGAHLVFQLVDVGFRLVTRHGEQQLAGQRVSVSVQAIGRQAQEHIAFADFLAVDDAPALHYAEDESRKIIFAGWIKSRHLGSFAANERAIIVGASVSDAADHALGHIGIQLAGRQIIHEEQRRGALHGDIVDAMIDQVGADGVVDLHLEGHLELGAHAVHAGNQHRVAVALAVEREQAAESADLAQHPAGKSFVGQIADALLGAFGAVNIHAGVGVGNRFARCRRHERTLAGQWSGAAKRLFYHRSFHDLARPPNNAAKNPRTLPKNPLCGVFVEDAGATDAAFSAGGTTSVAANSGGGAVRRAATALESGGNGSARKTNGASTSTRTAFGLAGAGWVSFAAMLGACWAATGDGFGIGSLMLGASATAGMLVAAGSGHPHSWLLAAAPLIFPAAKETESPAFT